MDNWFEWIVGGILCVILYGVFLPPTPEEIAKDKQHEIECSKPKLVSKTPDGLELWAHKWCNEYPVYFTSRGAKWDELRPAGKTAYVNHQETLSDEQ